MLKMPHVHSRNHFDKLFVKVWNQFISKDSLLQLALFFAIFNHSSDENGK